MDKIIARIRSWTSKFLTYAGRLQLIQSVLSSMYGYWGNVFLLPSKFIKDAERVCGSFLWKEEASFAIGAKVSYTQVCRPKAEGGLGLKRVLDWNKACLARIIWLLYEGSESL